MNCDVTLIVPPVVCHNLDPHTGIPFMPHMAAHMAGALHKEKYNVQVIDAFGLQPNNRVLRDEFMLLGVTEEWIVEKINTNSSIVFIYCRTMSEFTSIVKLSGLIKQKNKEIKIVLFENIQSVTSFSLSEIADELLDAGCDLLILGEPELRAKDVTTTLLCNEDLNKIPGLIWKENGKLKKTPSENFNKELDDLPKPLWEKFPLKGYWIAGYAHAPNTHYKFLPILTSRGCPYRCTFCISPSLNPTWRGRSAKSVVDEMEYFFKRLNVREFHVSDLDPTVKESRTIEICEELIKRKLPIIWKLAQGTKIETIKSLTTVDLLKKSGLTFLAFSPESGSSNLLKIMNKPFNHDHGIKMVKRMNEVGIVTQACFIGGVPGETIEDRKQSFSYLKKLMKAGLDEVAVYIFAPIPGAELSKALKGYNSFSQCTFSPTWREDYKEVNKYRFEMYIIYFTRLMFKPHKIFKRLIGFLTGSHNTKMEMSIKKQIKFWLLRYTPFLYLKLDPDYELKKAYLHEVNVRSDY